MLESDLPTTRLPHRTMHDVKVANRAAGQTWFGRAEFAWFNTALKGGPYGGRYFVTSEQPGLETPAAYSVRVVLDSGAIETVGEFMGHRTLEGARLAAKTLARRLVDPTPATTH